jgi:F-type H+-transporting ATPase subunit epsilon
MLSAFNFELVSPERLLFSEKVTSVVVPGVDGYFTVMADHAPFITTISCGIVEVVLASGIGKKIYVSGGFADVDGSTLTLLAEQAVPIEDVNSDMMVQQLQIAMNDVLSAKTESKQEYANLKLNRLKSLADEFKFS